MGLAENPHGAAFAVGAVIIFFLFSHASEFIDTSGRLHLVFILAVVGMMAAIASGGLSNTATSKPGIWLTLFTVWMLLGIPFSSWKGESVRDFLNMWMKSYLVFFLVGGLIFTVQQCRKTLFWLAAATVAVIYYAFRSGANSEDERLSVTYGSLGNSNDLAAALLMGIPFLFFVALDKRRNAVLRGACVLATVVLLLVVVRTGSRGAIFAILAMILLAFFKTNAGNKLKIVVLCVLLMLGFPMVVSKNLMSRYATILHSSQASNWEAASAIDSTNARRELMRNGVILTLRHPVFGVGLGNFNHQSANLFMAKGEYPLWFTCHDIFLLVSSETGIPGIIMYLGVAVVCYRSLFRMQKAALLSSDGQEVANMAFCIMISLTAYLVCGVFSTAAYSVSLPLVAGLTAALERVSKPLMAGAESQQPQYFTPAPAFSRVPAVARFPQSTPGVFRS